MVACRRSGRTKFSLYGWLHDVSIEIEPVF